MLPKEPTKQKTTADVLIVGGIELPRTPEAVEPSTLPPLVGVVSELQTLAYAARENLPVLLIGDTGTGKTSLVRWLAKTTGNVYRRLNLNGGTTADELAGRYIVSQENGAATMKWIDGVLIDAMKRGHWLLLDEINAALPEVLFYLHALLDDDRQVVLAEKNGEIVEPHPEFRLFATMNPSLEYAGTRDLNKAFLSRFPIVLQVVYPSLLGEIAIVQAHSPTIAPEHATLLCKVAADLRKAHKEGELSYICSTRDLLHWARLLSSFDLQEAATLAIVNRAQGEEDVKAVKDVLRLHIGKLAADGAASFDLADLQKKASRVERAEEIVSALAIGIGLTLKPEALAELFDAPEFDAAKMIATVKAKKKKAA